MKKKLEIKIAKYIKLKSQVKLYYFEDEIYGRILKESDNFIVICDIKDWHYDGYMIFPKKYISKIKYGKLEKFREEIMNKFSLTIKVNLEWLNIDSYHTIFSSLSQNYNEICIESALKDINHFMLGKIVKQSKNNLYINKLDTYGTWGIGKIKIPTKNITCIYFKDEYSSTLFKYSKGLGDTNAK